MSQIKLNRREFLFASAMGAAGVALAACAKTPSTEQPTQAPTAAQATATPAPTNTPIPTQAATATPVPTAVASKEAPELAELVAAGKLPPLADRLPKVPLTLAGVDGVGKYGGRIRTFGATLGNYMEEWMYGHSPLRWIDDGQGIAPGMCDTWETNDDNSEWTVHIREGLKWSDGEPCTVDDVLFWWNDLVLNTDFPDQPPDFGQAGGQLVQMVRVDDYTLTLKYVVPAPLTAKRLAMWVNANVGPRWIAPAHYCKQFHPKYNTEMKDVETLREKILFRQNPDCPALTSWVCEKYDPGQSRTWKRNPYYYCVDTEGNQLPYIDGIDEKMIADAQVQVLTVLQGGVDYLPPVNHLMAFSDIATVNEGQDAGKYILTLLDGGGGSGIYYFHNFDTPDDKKRELYRNPDFKRAMGHCMDRPTIQKVIFFGTGELTSGTMSPKAIEFNYNDQGRQVYAKWRDMFVEYDIEKAKGLLDGIGVVDANGDGWREFPDGSKLEIRIDYPADMSAMNVQGLEICTKGWNAAGLMIVNNPVPPAEFGTMWQSGQGEIRAGWGASDGPDLLVYPSWLVPNEPERFAPLCGNRYQMLGTEKEDTELDKSPWERTPPRWASMEPGFADTVIPKMQDMLTQALLEPDAMVRMQIVWDLVDIHVEQGGFGMGSVANQSRIYIKNQDLINVPDKEDLALGGFSDPWIVPHPALHNTETFSWK
ncbi:MAG: ABC transporter substrate-binding protein [Anaerolineales bacterium]